ncbi:hypothetical protein ABFS83_07G020800 [Erythranthe nasuta]
MKFVDWYLKIAVVSAMIGGSMEFFMIKTGFYDKVTELESEKRAWENTPEAQAARDALNPWRGRDNKDASESSLTKKVCKQTKKAAHTLSLGGFEVIDEIKTQLEKTCPGIVSCADILALAARDSVSFKFNKPMWEVETGRRDGIVSRESDALNELPSPASDFKTLKQSFADKGLSVKDLVVLSGAHTIGVGKCIVFSNRLYNFTGKGDTDTSLNTTYAATLRSKCRSLSDQTTTVEMDPTSSLNFDNHYFTALKLRQGLFQSDAALLTNDVARGVVDQMLTSGKFYTQFGKSMKKMGAIGVLTGDEGKIRKKCNIV